MCLSRLPFFSAQTLFVVEANYVLVVVATGFIIFNRFLMFKSREKHINIRFVSTCGLQLRKFIYFFRRWLAQWKRVHFFHFIKPLPYIALHVILSIILARCVSIYVPFKNLEITRVKEMMVMMTSLIHCSYTELSSFSSYFFLSSLLLSPFRSKSL